MSTTRTPADPPNPVIAFLLTAVGYVLAAVATAPLAIPPGYASPLVPAAGVALAGVLIGGPRMVWAAALGAFIVNLAPVLQIGGARPTALALPLSVAATIAALIAIGAALQAWIGAALVKRHVQQPMTLSEPRDVLAFLIASMVACTVDAAIANIGLAALHLVTAARLPQNVATYWFGNLLGVLIATPVVLTLFAQPRAVWAPRRRLVGLTLSLIAGLLALGIRQVVEWNHERTQSAFEADAAIASLAFSAQLHEPLAALDALYGVFLASEEVSPEEMHLASGLWLAHGGIEAIAWSERVARPDVPAFEDRVRAADNRRYRVFDAPLAADAPATSGERDVVAIRYIEPPMANSAARGLDLMSNPAMRSAIERAGSSGEPVASAGFRLVNQADADGRLGVVVVRGVFNRKVPTMPRPDGELLGIVSVTVRLEDQLEALAGRIPSHLTLCLLDVTRSAAQSSAGAPALAAPTVPAAAQRLAGPADCETRQSAYERTHALDYAGRHWQLRVSAHADAPPSLRGGDVWLFGLVGLFSTAMLGGFLLILTGRTHRIEDAVEERTAALQAEVRERESAEAALRESEQRFRNILNHVPIGVIYSDLHGRVKQANPRFCELIGYSEKELLGLAVSDYSHPDDLSEEADLIGQLVRAEIPMYRRRQRYLSKQGETLWVQATVSLLRFADGEPRSIVAVVEDITEHLRLEEAEHAREAAEASNRAKSEFLSRMSHELRTPLNAMLGFAQLLELDPRHPLTAEQRPWVAQIQQAGWHLLEMINDVLDLSRIESGNLRLQTGTLNLVDLLDATTHMVEGDARRRGIAITRDIGVGTSTLLGDATRVKQILTNLLSNAVKYNAEGGRIHIASRLIDAETVEITVSDTGLGMTTTQMAGLFQPFNRLGRERAGPQGTGIGLVISQRLAELMGGSLHAESAAGQGSAFHLRLPCAIDPDTVRSDLGLLEAEPAEYHRRLVHYVEDNETNVEVMRGILAQRPQVELQVSVTGLDGLAAIRARRPDLILLDMHLPDISGMDLLRHLKTDVYTTGVPIVVVSADALAQQIDAAFDAGCTRYLTKPVSVAELLAVLDDLLERMDTRFG